MRRDVESLPAGLIVLTGPTRSGKTEALLGWYRAALRSLGPGSSLWLCPTARSAAETRTRLLGPDLPACLSPGVMTFDGFATSLLRDADDAIRPIGPVQQRLLLERLASEALAQGELEHFGPIAGTAGFVELLAQFISELKRLEVWPEEYAQVCHERHRTQKDRELSLLYGRYQEGLNRGRLYDAEGRFWWARTLLRDAEQQSSPSFRMVVADGFADFTYTQHEILELLAARAERTLVSLPLEAGDLRADLFRKSRDTLAILRERHEHLHVQELLRPDSGDWPAIAHLERELFCSPRQQRAANNPEPVDFAPIEIVAAAGQLGELESIARSIKQLLLDGDTAHPRQTVRPDDIVMALRGLRELGPLVTETFAEYGLPLALEAAPSLDRVPAIAAILGLVRLEIDDWPHDALLAAISNGFFRPSWPEWGGGATALDVDWIVRDLQIPSGRRLLREQIARWAELDRETGEQSRSTPTDNVTSDVAAAAAQRHRDQRRQHARGALPLVDRLIVALATLPQAGTGRQWAESLESLAAEINFDAVLAEDPSGRDAEAWGRLLAALVAEEELSLALGQPPRQLSRRQFVDLVRDLCRWERLSGGGSETGRVRVLAVESVRGLSVPYLYVAGLSESSFPQHREPALHRRREIEQLRAAGMRFDPPLDRGEDEMLLFYEVLTRATRRLHLSYPALDTAAGPLLPSPYLAEVERACGPGGYVRYEQPLSESALLTGDPMSPRELRVQAVGSALDGSVELLANLLSVDDGLARHLRGAWLTSASRGDRERFGPFEGLLVGDASLKELAERFGEQHCWNASDLEQYAYCPYQFFMQQILGVEPLADLRLEIDFRERGKLLHDALATVYRRIGTADADPAIAEPDKFRREFVSAVDELLERGEDSSPLTPAWQAIDRRVLLRWCDNYLVQAADYAGKLSGRGTTPTPAYFEVSFGIPSEADRPPSVATPLRLSDGSDSVLLRGRIDRIDIATLANKTLVRVVDYKGSAGKRTKPGAALDSTALQADLYAVAAEELILADRQAISVASGYWYLRKSGYVPAFEFEHPDDLSDYKARREELVRTILGLARGPGRGEFPIFSADEYCTGHCDYRTVCRVNQIRGLEKTWPTSERGPS